MKVTSRCFIYYPPFPLNPLPSPSYLLLLLFLSAPYPITFLLPLRFIFSYFPLLVQCRVPHKFVWVLKGIHISFEPDMKLRIRYLSCRKAGTS
jgi:hypothetical protein